MSPSAATAVRPAEFLSPPPAVVSAESDLIAENTKLRRDVKSLSSRTRAMEAALTAIRPRASELPVAPVVVGTWATGDLVSEVVRAAQTTEALGDVPAIRFVRNFSGVVVGIEVAAIPVASDVGDEFDPTFRALAQLACGMAVVE